MTNNSGGTASETNLGEGVGVRRFACIREDGIVQEATAGTGKM